MKSLGVCTFFGSGANRLQEELGFDFEDATPPAADVLSVEWQPAISDTTTQHVNNRAQQWRNQATNIVTA